MKEFATAVVIAVFGIVLLTASSGDGFCFGHERPQLGDNSTCSDRNDFATAMCRLRCLFCHFGNVSQPYGCITEGKNGTCLCIEKESGDDNDNGTSTGQPSTPTPVTTELPGGDSTTSAAPGIESTPEDPDGEGENGINVG